MPSQCHTPGRFPRSAAIGPLRPFGIVRSAPPASPRPKLHRVTFQARSSFGTSPSGMGTDGCCQMLPRGGCLHPNCLTMRSSERRPSVTHAACSADSAASMAATGAASLSLGVRLLQRLPSPVKMRCPGNCSRALPWSLALQDLVFTRFSDHLRASPVSIYRFSAWLCYPETAKAPASNLPALSFASPPLRGSCCLRKAVLYRAFSRATNPAPWHTSP